MNDPAYQELAVCALVAMVEDGIITEVEAIEAVPRIASRMDGNEREGQKIACKAVSYSNTSSVPRIAKNTFFGRSPPHVPHILGELSVLPEML